MANEFVIHPDTHLGPIHLTVQDRERSLDFYTNVLGFRMGEGRDSAAWLTTDGDTSLLNLVEERDAQPKPPGTTGLYHFAILVPSRTDLARSLRRLIEVRYPLQGAADHLVSEALYLADPDGNGIEIYADRPPAAWPRRDGQLQMATEPLDAPGLMAELTNDSRPWQGLPPRTRIGHIHLHVADLKQAEDFYCHGLGFDMVTYYPPQQAAKGSPSALFISAGGYHHHIGLNTWAGRGAPPPPPSSVGLRFYTLYLPNREELEQVARHLEAAGVEYEETGDAISMRDPSGNQVRLEAKNVPHNLAARGD